MSDCVQQFDKKVTIEKLSGTADAHGHIDQTSSANWTRYTSAFCSCISKGGKEFWKVQQVNADVTHVWSSPWSKTLAAATPDMRLVHEGVTHNILSVVDVDLAHEVVQIQTKRAV